jgi:hypothetical protein
MAEVSGTNVPPMHILFFNGRFTEQYAQSFISFLCESKQRRKNFLLTFDEAMLAIDNAQSMRWEFAREIVHFALESLQQTFTLSRIVRFPDTFLKFFVSLS